MIRICEPLCIRDFDARFEEVSGSVQRRGFQCAFDFENKVLYRNMSVIPTLALRVIMRT